jgi:hypothetical protein
MSNNNRPPRPQSMMPSFSDITIWPYDVQLKNRPTVRINAASERAALRKALHLFDLVRKPSGTTVEVVVATSEQMHRILA